jgi:hypothetical protein
MQSNAQEFVYLSLNQANAILTASQGGWQIPG